MLKQRKMYILRICRYKTLNMRYTIGTDTLILLTCFSTIPGSACAHYRLSGSNCTGTVPERTTHGTGSQNESVRTYRCIYRCAQVGRAAPSWYPIPLQEHYYDNDNRFLLPNSQ